MFPLPPQNIAASENFPLLAETTAWNNGVVTVGSTTNAVEIRAVNLFVTAGKKNGWWDKIIDCCFFVGGDLTGALVKQKIGTGTSTTVQNRGSGLYGGLSATTGFGVPWTGSVFPPNFYTRTGVGAGIRNDLSLRELGPDFTPSNFTGISVDNFSFGLITEKLRVDGSATVTGSQSLLLGSNETGQLGTTYTVTQPTLVEMVPYSTAGFESYAYAWPRTNNICISYGSTSTRMAVDGQAIFNEDAVQVRSVQHPAFQVNSEITLLQACGSLGFKQQGEGTIGGYFFGENMTIDELSSLSLEMKLLHYRAHLIPDAPLYAAIGDSLTYGATTGAPWDFSWFPYVAQGANAYQMNMGMFNGMCTANSPVGAGLGVLNRYTDIFQVSPHTVWIMIGTNDMRPPPVGVDSTTNGDPAVLADYQQVLIDVANNLKNSGSRVVLMTPPYNTIANSTKLIAYATAVENAATASDSIFVDTLTPILNTASPSSWLQVDGVHLQYFYHTLISQLATTAAPAP